MGSGNLLKETAFGPEGGRVPAALTIAGFDPGSGAGATADLKTFAAHRVYGAACLTALTIQSTSGVRSMHPVSVEIVRETLACLQEDIAFAGIKIGMLGSGPVAAEVAAFLAAKPVPRSRIVLDPVVRSSSGKPLIDSAGLEVICEKLLAQVGWITPNLDELAVLAGFRASPGSSGNPGLSRDQIPDTAHRLRQAAADMGNRELSIVVTGGHLARPDDYLLMAAGEESWLSGESIATSSTHGTGCAYSTALLCRLIAGDTSADAAAGAKQYVAQAMRSAYPVGKGHGPVNHLYLLD